VVRCLARAHTCGNEPSRPLVEHFRSHSRTRRFNSTRTSRSCNFAAGLALHVKTALVASPRCHAVCRQAAAEPASTAPLLSCACFCRTHVHSSLLLFLLICWTRVALALSCRTCTTVALHTVATSARQRPASLTPRPAAGPSRPSAPCASAFRRTPKLRPRYCHRVPASCAKTFHRNSSYACHRSARRCLAQLLLFSCCRTRACSAFIAHVPQPQLHSHARASSSAASVPGLHSCSCVARVLPRRRRSPLLAPRASTPARLCSRVLPLPSVRASAREPASTLEPSRAFARSRRARLRSLCLSRACAHRSGSRAGAA
jgi:hypothetical protein